MDWKDATTGGTPTSYTVTIQYSVNGSKWFSQTTHTVYTSIDTYSPLTSNYYYRFSVIAHNSAGDSLTSGNSSGVQNAVI